MKTPDHAFVLAAGLGSRLRPYTDTLPKPLVPVQGKPLLAYIFEHLEAAGVTDIVVNLHHLAPVLEDFLDLYPELELTRSYEEELLDTGGGVKKMLDRLGAAPFYIINGDALWMDGPSGRALFLLGRKFSAVAMDILLLLQPVDHMHLTQGVGDYDLGPDGRAVRNRAKTGAYMFAGVRLCRPEIFQESPDGKFSFLQLMDRAEAAERLFGLVHDGDWHHISTPQDLEAVNAALAKTS